MDVKKTEEQLRAERRKYVDSFNRTMVRIWKEKITLYDVIDTKSLLRSVWALGYGSDLKVINCFFNLEFLEYGLWQDYGVGGEVPRGNPGDIGRPKVRERRPWFSKKYFASVMNIKEFMADSLGEEFCAIMTSAVNDTVFRQNHPVNDLNIGNNFFD